MPGPAVVQSVVTDPGGSASATVAATLAGVTVGNSIVLFFGTGDAPNTLSSISDGHNTYTLLGTSTALAGYAVWAYLATNVGTGGSLTFTATFGSSTTFNFMHAIEVTSSVLDVWSAYATGSSATATSPSATTTATNDLGLAFAVFDNGGETAGSTWTLVKNAPNAAVLSEQKALASAGATTATATGTSGGWLIAFAALKTPSGASDYLSAWSEPATPRARRTAAALNETGALDATVPFGVHEFLPNVEPLPHWRAPPPIWGDAPLDATVPPATTLSYISWAEPALARRSPGTVYVDLAGSGSSSGVYVGEFLAWADVPHPPQARRPGPETVAPLDALQSVAALLNFASWSDAPAPARRTAPPAEGWSPLDIVTAPPPGVFQAWTTDGPPQRDTKPPIPDDAASSALRPLALAAFLAWNDPAPALRRTAPLADGVGPLDATVPPAVLGFAFWTTDPPPQRKPTKAAESAAPLDVTTANPIRNFGDWTTAPTRWTPTRPGIEPPFLGVSAPIVALAEFQQWPGDLPAPRRPAAPQNDTSVLGPLALSLFGRSVDWTTDAPRRAGAPQRLESASPLDPLSPPPLAPWRGLDDAPGRRVAPRAPLESPYPLDAVKIFVPLSFVGVGDAPLIPRPRRTWAPFEPPYFYDASTAGRVTGPLCLHPMVAALLALDPTQVMLATLYPIAAPLLALDPTEEGC